MNNSPGADTCEQPVWVGLEWISIDARPIHIKVCPDRNCIRLRVNKIDTYECYSYSMKLSSDRMG